MITAIFHPHPKPEGSPDMTFHCEGEPMTIEEVHQHIRDVTGKEPVGEWPRFWCRDLLTRELLYGQRAAH